VTELVGRPPDRAGDRHVAAAPLAHDPAKAELLDRRPAGDQHAASSERRTKSLLIGVPPEA